jgi:lipoyl(octanoyl) transferase
MDLAPFSAINPCGYPGLHVTQTRDLGMTGSADDLGRKLAAILAGRLEHA